MPVAVLNTMRVVSNASIKVAPGLRKIHKVHRINELLNTYKTTGLADIYNRHLNYNDLNALIVNYDDDSDLLDDIAPLNDNNDFINKILAQDYRSYMVDDVLTKVDRATMSVALEGREPLLDHRIVEFVSQLPSDLKYHNGTTKYLLKNICLLYTSRCV